MSHDRTSATGAADERSHTPPHPPAHGTLPIGLLISAICYSILAIRQPSQWTVPVWAGIAFVIVPVIVGVAVGMSCGATVTPGARFKVAVTAVAPPMMLYTLITLIVLHSRLGVRVDPMQVTLVVFLVTGVYGAIAGIVAGVTSAAVLGRSAPR